MYRLIIKSGNKAWSKNGFWHRCNDLPAIEFSNGYKEWWKKGKHYFLKKYENGTKEYYNFKGQLDSCSNEPAIIYSNGDKEYWYNGKRHKSDGPAVIYGNKQYWFEYGEFIKCIV
ncbi:MAG: hypothetical protein EKK64_00830 [Neisseriaceae bacterium]|nr:MAG: hypothetical protein EKK64_00830 [Neisseriaceae bacterium]